VERKAILLNARDDVATALTALQAGETVHVALGEVTREVTLREEIPFAHKFALRDLAAGEEILKYGLPIGAALRPIRAGEWVHVHNCRSGRFGFLHEKYGIQA
jgi:altronate dehydratase small subunit